MEKTWNSFTYIGPPFYVIYQLFITCHFLSLSRTFNKMNKLTFIALSLILENGVLNDGKTEDFLFFLSN